MKVIKHCSQTFPTTATGFLVGMDVLSTLQITNSFPFPTVEAPPNDNHHDNQNSSSNLAAAAPRAKSNAAYQVEMIKKLREVNVDANNVGWYTSANLGNFVNMNMIENQYFYQKELNERTVAIVHDVSRSSQGSLSLRAFRLSPPFMTAYKEGKFSTERSNPQLKKFSHFSRPPNNYNLAAFKNPTSATKISSKNSPSPSTTLTSSPPTYTRSRPPPPPIIQPSLPPHPYLRTPSSNP